MFNRLILYLYPLTAGYGHLLCACRKKCLSVRRRTCVERLDGQVGMKFGISTPLKVQIFLWKMLWNKLPNSDLFSRFTHGQYPLVLSTRTTLIPPNMYFFYLPKNTETCSNEEQTSHLNTLMGCGKA